MAEAGINMKTSYKRSKTSLMAKWIVHTDKGTMECDNCRNTVKTAYMVIADFCPCCGAAMIYGAGKK